MRRSQSTQAQSTASHCRMTSPTVQDCLRMHSKVSSDWLPSYILATRPVLEIFKMAGFFPDSPCTREVKDKALTLSSYERNEEYRLILDVLIEGRPL